MTPNEVLSRERSSHVVVDSPPRLEVLYVSSAHIVSLSTDPSRASSSPATHSRAPAVFIRGAYPSDGLGVQPAPHSWGSPGSLEPSGAGSLRRCDPFPA